jgi:O-antigen/teichoic acid export membrane protein
MKKKFLSNLFLIIILNIIIKPLYILGIDAEIINRVGEFEYGQYFAIINLTFVFNIFLDLGINNFNVKNLSQHSFLLKKYLSKIISLKILFFFLYLFIVLFFGSFFNYNFELLILLAINQALAVFVLYVRSNLAGLHMFFEDSIISVLDRFLLIVICSILLWGGLTSNVFEIEWFVYAQTISYFISACVALKMLFKKINNFQIHWDPIFSLAILKKSLPYALLILLMTVYYRVDVIMLESIIGPEEAGLYATSFRFFEASNMIAFLFAVLLLPIFSRLLKKKESINDITFISFKILMSLSVTIFFICYFFNEQIIDFRYGNGSLSAYVLNESYIILPILMGCFVCVSLTYIFGTLLTANGNLYHLNLISVGGVIINLLLNIILIPTYGAFGSALTSLVTQFLVTIIQIYFCFRLFKLYSFKDYFFPFFLFSFGLILIGKISHNIFNEWYVNMFIFGFLSIIWAILTQMIRFDYIKTIISNKV